LQVFQKWYEGEASSGPVCDYNKLGELRRNSSWQLWSKFFSSVVPVYAGLHGFATTGHQLWPRIMWLPVAEHMELQRQQGTLTTYKYMNSLAYNNPTYRRRSLQ
jgi:hypothetical protein